MVRQVAAANSFMVRQVKLCSMLKMRFRFLIDCMFTSITLKAVCYANDYKCPIGKLYNEKDGKCYNSGTISPCFGDSQIYTERWDKPGYGECTCLPYNGFIIRPIVQSVENGPCYWLFDQGPCAEGEWLALNKYTNNYRLRKGICTKRKCPENVSNPKVEHSRFWFEHEGKCLQTARTSMEFCGNDKDKIYFSVDNLKPICLHKPPLILTIISRNGIVRRRFRRETTEKGCPDGFKKLRNGDCRPFPNSGQDDDNSSDESSDESDEIDKDRNDNHQLDTGLGKHKGALGYGPYKGALGYGPYKGAAGYGPYEGALGQGQYSG